MRRSLRLSLLLILLLPVLPAAGEVVGQSDQEVRAVAEPILDNLLAGFNAGDYAQYSRDFDTTLKEAISPKKFQQTRQTILNKMGKYEAKSFLGFLQQGRMTVVLWKGKFAKTEDDVLIKLVLSKRPEKTVVVGLWFQ
ncbi:MAG: DUF3887 domain-containing protein [Thermodesulfobacteriota bacterium]